MKKVLYTGAFSFPDKDAAAIRVFGISQLFSIKDYDISFAGWEEKTVDDDCYKFNGFNCYPQSEFSKGSGLLQRAFRSVTLGLRTFRWIRKQHLYNIIILYNPPALFALLMLIWCKLKKISLILDNTEWYESAHIINWSGGPYSIKSYFLVFENFIRMRFVYPMFANVIAISYFLEKYYSRCNVIRIPSISFESIDLEFSQNFIPDLKDVDCINFIYAGSAGEKDYLLDFIVAIPDISALIDKNIKLHIVGANEVKIEELLHKANFPAEKYKKYYKAYGWIKHAHVKDIYKISHFSILFREDKRYALAGFPTKLMESWQSGRPVFANKVGDLAEIGSPGIDVIFVSRKAMVNDVSIALRKILSDNTYKSMSTFCKLNSILHLSNNSYSSKFNDFLLKLK